MSGFLLTVTARVDIGVDGISLVFPAVDEDLAGLLKSAGTFVVQEPTRHSLGTSDVVLLSDKALGFVDRPEPEPIEDNGSNMPTCGCSSKPLEEGTVDKPLEP